MKWITPIETIRRRFASADFSETAASETPLDPCRPDDGNDDPAIPPRIAALIAQREAARAAAFGPIPLSGQIVRVPPRPDDAGNLYNEYLAVLLDAEIALGKWRGWMVGRDSDYASEWDLILGPEEEPRDPMCQLVQIWNPVSLTIQEADRVLAELTDERLAAARAMARDHAQKLIPAPIDDNRMSVHLARELADGTGVVTGTSAMDANDPRHVYQSLFKEVGIRLGELPSSQAVNLAVNDSIRTSSDLFDQLFELSTAIATRLSASSVREQRISFSIAPPNDYAESLRLDHDAGKLGEIPDAVIQMSSEDEDDAIEVFPILFELDEYYKGRAPNLSATYVDGLYDQIFCILNGLITQSLDSSKEKKEAARETIFFAIYIFEQQLASIARAGDSENNYARAEANFERALLLLDSVSAGFGDSGYSNVGILDLLRIYQGAGRNDEASTLRNSILESLLQRFRVEAVYTTDFHELVIRVCRCAKELASENCFNEAEILFKLAIDIASGRQDSDLRLTLQATEKLADFYLDCGRDADALVIFSQILSAAPIGYERFATLVKMTKIYQNQKQWVSALRLVREAIVLAVSRKEDIERSFVEVVLAQLNDFEDQGRYEDGVRLVIEFLEIAKNSLHDCGVKEAMSVAYRIYVKQGRVSEAGAILELLKNIQ